MVVEVPSSVTIVNNDDLSNCEIPSSMTDVTPSLRLLTESSAGPLTSSHEYPFEFLSGEILIEHGMDSTDGLIYLTSYRLFIYSNQSSTGSFINCPLRFIESIEIKDTVYLYVQCKDVRSFRLIFFTSDKCCYWARKLNESIAVPAGLDDLFALKYRTSVKVEEATPCVPCESVPHEFARLQLNASPWRTTDINRDYKLCTSYPTVCVVPESITDDEINEVAKFRSYRRFPTIVWRHANGAVIARTSQPEVGWLFWRSKEDEKMIQAIISACHSTALKSKDGLEPSVNRLLILDARSYAAAIANRAKGGGFEYPPYYTDCDVQFMNLPNIHAIRKSTQMLRAAIVNAAQGETWLSQLESTRWLHNLSALISVASFVVATIDKQARPVLVHCSDGWDRTPQITTLAKLMLDSYYRTIEGFQTLVQREWLGYGHKFADRCGHGLGASDPNERSPVFLQWLDCIYQVFRQNPTAFEFNEMFLLKLANHTYTCLYGTFLCNTDCERSAASLESRTVSLWTLLNKTSTQYVNPLFDHTKKEILYPSSSVRDLTIWSNLYLRDMRHSPIGSAEPVAALLSARMRSFEDLSHAVTNGLHRSTSDPSLTSSTHRDANPPVSDGTNPSPSPNQPSPSNRLQNSTSTNSLFGLPHDLGTFTDSHPNVATNSNPNHSNQQISFPINLSPDTRIKRESFAIDDSAPDITQLALSFQRFPISVTSVDHILRTMSLARKPTNSTSSAASSFSEAGSLSRINSSDPSQTQPLTHGLTPNKIIKLVRKCIDVDGLTKIPDQITLRMLEKERAYKECIDRLDEDVKRMRRFIYILVSGKQHQNDVPRQESISQSNLNSSTASTCSSWQKIDHSDPSVTRWMPDDHASRCHGCTTKFQQWPVSRKHHCRKCGDVFCNNCANQYTVIPSLNQTRSVRVCRDCFTAMDENHSSNGAVEPTRPSAASPMPIHAGCRQANGTPNGSFHSPGGHKVKG